MTSNKRENLTYLGVWLLIFILSAASTYIRSTISPEDNFLWSDVFHVWKVLAEYLAVFLIHNFFIAPLLVNKHRKWHYIGAVSVLILAMMTYHFADHPDRNRPLHRPPHDMEMLDKAHSPRPDRPPMGMHEALTLLVLLTLLGTNLGIKYYYRTEVERERMLQLKAENLQQELDYLSYQVNPHFFMNTLNNIHALVDINPEQAKDSVILLSKLMRYVLYDGAREKVTLDSATRFLKAYIDLMRMRYSDNLVDINMTLPARDLTTVSVPPLLMIPFVENAFKHGVSYNTPSFIDITIALNDGLTVCFKCRNSVCNENEQHSQGGVGLSNVRRRLNLIYGEDNYSLVTRVEPGQERVYSVTLSFPVL